MLYNWPGDVLETYDGSPNFNEQRSCGVACKVRMHWALSSGFRSLESTESLSTALVFILPSPTFTRVCSLIHSAEISSTWQLKYLSPHCAIARALEILAGHQDKGEKNKSSWHGGMTASHYEML
jgi:hypothetical protein